MKPATQKIAIIGSVALALALVVVLVLRSRAKAAVPASPPVTPADPPPVTPPNPPVEPPKPPAKISGFMPNAVPTQGDFYAVKKNDNPDSVLRAAGFTGIITNAKTKMINHVENAWIGTERSLGSKAFYQRWTKTPGYTDRPWSYKGTWKGNSSPNYGYAVIYIPLAAEVQS